nr:unnamed protein product [Digitaria exilis]
MAWVSSSCAFMVHTSSRASSRNWKLGWIVCNDCRDTTQVFSSVPGHKCCHCQSHNTCRVAPPVLP